MAACIEEVTNNHQRRESPSTSPNSFPGERFRIARTLSSTFFLNEIDSAERICPRSVAFKPNSVVELFDLLVTGFSALSVTSSHAPFLKFRVWSELHFASNCPRAAHRIFIFIPHLRIFYHFVTFREVLFRVLPHGFLRAFFESHFVVFRYEVHQA